MQPTMSEKPEPLGLFCEGERLGQAAGLVELDVHRIVFADEGRERRSPVHAFVGAERTQVFDPRQQLVAIGRQRLLDQRDTGLGTGGEVGSEIVRRPAFIGVHDELRIAARRAAPPRSAPDRRRRRA